MSVVYAFMIINLVLWNLQVKPLFTGRDLNRLGSLTTTTPITEDIHYTQHHAELAEYLASGKRESFDVLTIGDSFTNGKDGGSYPDYLVNHYSLSVLNARLGNYDCVSTLYMLSTSGLLDEIAPRVVILESVERSVQGRFGSRILTPAGTDMPALERLLRGTRANANFSEGLMPPIMTQANMNYIYHKLYHFLKPGQLSPEVYITELNRPFFTNPGQERTLLHYYEDLNYLTHPVDAEMVNQNLNNASRLLKAKGINLIFFAAADKYDLYYPYITDKRGRPENPFFRKMREVPDKEYVFLDAMNPLREALERGEQDIYWLNDTHWSHKGIKIVCDELVRYILP